MWSEVVALCYMVIIIFKVEVALPIQAALSRLYENNKFWFCEVGISPTSGLMLHGDHITSPFFCNIDSDYSGGYTAKCSAYPTKSCWLCVNVSDLFLKFSMPHNHWSVMGGLFTTFIVSSRVLGCIALVVHKTSTHNLWYIDNSWNSKKEMNRWTLQIGSSRRSSTSRPRSSSVQRRRRRWCSREVSGELSILAIRPVTRH